jgi:hypothetical protein
MTVLAIPPHLQENPQQNTHTHNPLPTVRLLSKSSLCAADPLLPRKRKHALSTPLRNPKPSPKLKTQRIQKTQRIEENRWLFSKRADLGFM